MADLTSKQSRKYRLLENSLEHLELFKEYNLTLDECFNFLVLYDELSIRELKDLDYLRDRLDIHLEDL